MYRNTTSLFLLCAIWLFAPLAASAVTINTAYVGNVGNANDPLTGNLYGGVSYDYRIGTTEVTVGQYTAFLNGVAATDTYGLYSPMMATDLNIAGIARSGVSGSYTYSVMGSANHPVTYVSWADAARFSNWLNNGQPTGAQSASTTEDGAYTLNGAISDAALTAVTRNSGATWFIPSESEWYKAAYHQSTAQGGDADNYWLYPTGTNSTPYSDQPPGSDAPTQSNTANVGSNGNIPGFPGNGFNEGYAVTGSTIYSASQNYLADAGAYMLSASPYGTYDQGGNVWEWNETLITTVTTGSTRGLRGGSWSDIAFFLRSSNRGSQSPSTEDDYNLGFRVATVPEPSSLVLAAFGLVGLAAWGYRRRKR
jgi:formylglycine-generating enzyme required for sulfatase activity